MATRTKNRSQRGNQKGQNHQGRRGKRHQDADGIIPVLARTVREVEHAAQRGQVTGFERTKYQVVALLAREERVRVRADKEISEDRRDIELKRLDGIGTILAQTAASEPSFFELLQEDAEISKAAMAFKRQLQRKAGLEPDPEPVPAEPGDPLSRPTQIPVPPSVRARQLANPFMPPEFRDIPRPQTRRLSGWELIEPLLNSFEHASPGAPACMDLPEPDGLKVGKLELMPHQAKVVAAVRQGHRTFLLADEPGLGKTAQALLAAEAAGAFPLLCVVPNVVKTNWAREVSRWVPHRNVTVVHGDGQNVDGFADIVIVNYEILDRHVGWVGDHGFRGMIVDEAHFIKNKKSQRSTHVRETADRIRARVSRPLMMALTGTPLINEIDDFRAIWEFLGWIDEKKPRRVLMAKLEETGFTPLDHPFYPAARQAVIDMGIVRRRKVEVAKEIPARRIADMPVELEGAVGRSVRDAERKLAARLLERYRAALATRRSDHEVEGIDQELVRRVATWELHEAKEKKSSGEENVFSMVRRIGQAKAPLAADFAAQLAHSAGKVVFFAKHIDVMDAAQEVFASQSIKFSSVRGEQTSSTRQKNIDAFVNDTEVKVIVCSLTAAGVGLNLQVASDVVLAELSWTDAEQTQAIDRVHRIGQTEPVTAWRIIAAQTVDARIAELIDSKAGLAAKALDGADEDGDAVDIQVEALASLLTQALEASGGR